MKENKDLILSLLKAELKNTKLVTAIHSIGLQSEDFYLDIATQVLKLTGFPKPEQDEELLSFYFNRLHNKCNSDTYAFMENLNTHARDLYNELQIERIRRKTA